MTPELKKQLVEKYPKIFKMVGGLDVGDGWYWLLDQLCRELQYNTDKNNHPQIVAVQVKEKFGVLRFYVNGGIDEQYVIIHFAENLSFSICEFCGTTKDVSRLTKNGWMNTLCSSCREKNE